MSIKNIAILIISILCLAACSEKGNMDVAKAAYERKDYPAAIKEYTLLAEDGDAEAQYQLGWLYLTTQATRSEYREAYAQAAKWIRKAAEQDHVLAQHKMGYLYLMGHGVPEDAVQATYWYLKAADQGDVASVAGLGDIYRYGAGAFKKDPLVALAFYNIVLAKPSTSEETDNLQSSARNNLTELTSNVLSPDDVAAGTALADRMTSPGAVLSAVLAQHTKQ